MEDLELLKQHWNKPIADFKSYTEQDLFKMIKGRSANIARNLFLLGCLEMLLWFSYSYFGDDEIPYFKLILFFLLALALIYQYFKVKNEDNSRQLMRNILEIRWIILVYVFLSITFLIADYFINISSYTRESSAAFMDGWNMADSNVPLTKINPATMHPSFIVYVSFFFAFLLVICSLLYIYNRVYGKLLKKLKLNYHELSKAEQNIN